MIIEAKPEPIAVECAETAVIVVDMQNDFVRRMDCLTVQKSTFRRFKTPLMVGRDDS
jgi:hypothetical protein